MTYEGRTSQDNLQAFFAVCNTLSRSYTF